jgi:hypothetical protein
MERRFAGKKCDSEVDCTNKTKCSINMTLTAGEFDP